METAVKKISSALKLVMENLQTLTGSTPSAAVLDSTTVKPTVTTGRHDRGLLI